VRIASIPIKGLRKRLALRLRSVEADSGETVRHIRVPVGDLVAASALERLLTALRRHDFPFTHAETGRGQYASAGCSISDVSFFLIFAEIGGETVQGKLYELSICATKLTPKTMFSCVAEVLPDEANLTLWQRLVDNISAELERTLNAREIG
jgi:hypothetical protein